MLSNGLLWRGFLEQRGLAGRDKLLLLAPSNKLLVLKSRLGWISGAGRNIQLMAMDAEAETLTPVDLRDCGNLDTALTQVQTLFNGKSLGDDEHVRRVLGLAPEQITWSRSENSNSVVFRIRGLEFAQLQLGRRSQVDFWLGCARSRPYGGRLEPLEGNGRTDSRTAKYRLACRKLEICSKARAVARKPDPEGYSSNRCTAGSPVCVSTGPSFPRRGPRDD